MTNPAKTSIADHATHVLSMDPTAPYRLISRDEARERLSDADRTAFDQACQERDATMRQTIIDYGRGKDLDPIVAGREVTLIVAKNLSDQGWHPSAIELIVRDLGVVAAQLQHDFMAALDILTANDPTLTV
jgi:hypothetical protein